MALQHMHMECSRLLCDAGTLPAAGLASEKVEPGAGLTVGGLPGWMRHRVRGKHMRHGPQVRGSYLEVNRDSWCERRALSN